MTAAERKHPDLTFRNRRILYAAVTEYIATGEPVASRRLARRYGLELSPATIRNVLADLEELGLLRQPHTSAGRIPTDLGFRIFVDALVQMRDVSDEERQTVLKRMNDMRGAGQKEILRETGHLLSSLTGAVTVISPPKAEEAALAQLRFMPLNAGAILAVIVTQSGAVQNRVVPAPEAPNGQELERVNNFLAEHLTGQTLAGLRARLTEQMADEREQYVQLRAKSAQILEATASQTSLSAQVVIHGQGRLFERPEFSDVEKVRRYLRTFEDQERLVGLLDRTVMAGGVQVLIGSETNLTDVSDISLISTDFSPSGDAKGAVGVIGPARMDYGKIVPLVEFTASCVAGALDDPPDSEDS